MSDPASVALVSAGVTVGLMACVWLLSVARRDASIVDVFWGLGFVLIAWVACALGAGTPERKLLLTLCTTAWGLRLSLYLLWRNWGRGEDFRYGAMRRRHGERFWRVSLYTVFALQGALMWFISLPVQVGQSAAAALAWLDALGALLWVAGFVFETVGDWQLARFKADPRNRGKVMRTGLWRYTRHPNYFGDALLWWGLYLIAASTTVGAWTILSPVTMTFLLARVSGVPLLEKSLLRTRPEYGDYIHRTSAFVPWLPKRA